MEYRPLGELLIDMGAITYPNLVRAVSQAARSGKRLGEFLVAQGLIRPDQIEAALARQQVGEARFAEPSVLGTPNMPAKPVLAERISSSV